ncbi:hypothetical protein M427DRAFT_225358 [Gonapodya prolifera JEL478]|uniref:RING-type domain-containing protein n=1 Tax=Gonapodya prolifera (strain JEL478) TaxID=1344416 RepID=A0A139ANC8_GONPJ|nr:hypothetical protein M427DRAFT_225358 [Gonapodya prolifera JEL478]|eukprot:KXS18247.1 hypothetical protein M427DRAFT_225358 [Gonapodya prolifera JEL478]
MTHFHNTRPNGARRQLTPQITVQSSTHQVSTSSSTPMPSQLPTKSQDSPTLSTLSPPPQVNPSANFPSSSFSSSFPSSVPTISRQSPPSASAIASSSTSVVPSSAQTTLFYSQPTPRGKKGQRGADKARSSPSQAPPSLLTPQTLFHPPPLRPGVVGAPGWRSGQPRPAIAGGRKGGGGFVRGNFRFVVRTTARLSSSTPTALSSTELPLSAHPAPDWSRCEKDPDAPVPWTSVVEVIIPSPAQHPLRCPVCLDAPRAAHAGPCGHAYCLGCVLRYLKFTSAPQRRCAVCFDPLTRADLRPAHPVPQGTVDTPLSPSSLGAAVGIVDLLLVGRPAGSTHAGPANSIAAGTYPPVANGNPFARISAAGRGYEWAMWSRHMEESERGREESIEEGERVGWDEARRWCAARMAEVVAAGGAMTGDGNGEGGAAAIDEVKKLESPEDNGTVRNTGSSKGTSTGAGDGPTFYFYQHPTGAHLYLHPLTVKHLRAEHGDYSAFPPTLNRVPVLAIEEATVTRELRRRNPYLAHLPLGCDVAFLELDPSAVVKGEVVERFAGESALRAARREERREQEAKEDAWRENEERRVRDRQRREWEVATGRVGARREAEAKAAREAGRGSGSGEEGAGATAYEDFDSDDEGGAPKWREDEFVDLVGSSPPGQLAYTPPKPESTFASAARGPVTRQSPAGSWANRAGGAGVRNERRDTGIGRADMTTSGPKKVAGWSRGTPGGRQRERASSRKQGDPWASDESDDPYDEQRYLYRREQDQGAIFSFSPAQDSLVAEPFDDDLDDLVALQLEFEDAAAGVGEGAGGKAGWKGGNGGGKGLGVMKKRGKKVLLVSNGGRRARE